MANYLHRLAIDIGIFLRNPAKALQMAYAMRVRAGRYQLLHDIHISQEYHWLVAHLRGGTTVLDIGANIGDTPIYFSQFDSVVRVIAYEPIPDTYREAVSNVSRSPFAPKIRMVNGAVTATATSKRIDPGMLGGAMSDFQAIRSSKSGVMVQSVTLGQALEGLNNVAIKCDCEGAEAQIFKDADLKNVYAIQAECHNGSYAELSSALRSHGFTVSHVGDASAGMAYALKSRNPR